MTPNPNAAPHGEPLKEGNNGFWVFKYFGVQAVFIGPKFLTIGKITRCARGIHIRDVTTRTKGAITLSVHDNQLNSRVCAPLIKGGLNRQTHLVGHSVQRLWALQSDAAGLADDAD